MVVSPDSQPWHGQSWRPAEGSPPDPAPLEPVTVTVSQLAWEMAEWEIHALRGLTSTLKAQAQMHAQIHKAEADAKVPIADCDLFAYVCEQAVAHFEHNRMRALRHPRFRRRTADSPAPTEHARLDVPPVVQ